MGLAVVEGHFQRSREIDVAAQGQIGVDVGHADFRATGSGVVAGLINARAVDEKLGDDGFVVEELGESAAFLDEFGGGVQQFVRGAGVNAQGNFRIVKGKFLLGADDEVGHLIGGVSAVLVHAADGAVFKVGVAFPVVAGVGGAEGNHLSYLQPHGFQKFKGEVFGEIAFLQVLHVDGVHVLIEAVQGHAAADLLLYAIGHLGEPVGLHGFPEIAGGAGGHVFAVGGNGFELLSAHGILFFGGKFTGLFSIAAGVDEHAFVAFDHGLKEGNLVVMVVDEIVLKFGETLFGFGLERQHALIDDFVEHTAPVQRGVDV